MLKPSLLAVPATAKPKGYLRPHPVPERLFDRVTSDFFYLGDLEGEECHWTNKKTNGVLLIQCRHSGYIHVFPCNVNAMTGKAAAEWCAQTWMGCWDGPSEILTDSGSAYISEWRKALCARLGFHHLRCEVHQHRAMPAERAGKTIINMLRKELAYDKDVHWLEFSFPLLRRYHNTELYHGYSPNQLVFGQNKCWWNLRYDHPGECKDASAFFDEIQAGEKEGKRLGEKFPADWLSIANQGRKEPRDLEEGDRVWLGKSETTQKGDSKLLPLWEGPFEIVSRVRENSFKVRVDVNRELEASEDRLKPEIPTPKGRVKPLFWTSKWLSKRRIEGGNYELERLVDPSKDDEGNWRFLVKYKGFPESENTWEPHSSFVHGYTTGFRNYLRAHPEIPVLFTDCRSNPDLVVEKDGAKAVVVDGDPAPPPQIPAHSAPNPAPQGAVRPEAPHPPPKGAHEGNEASGAWTKTTRPVPRWRQAYSVEPGGCSLTFRDILSSSLYITHSHPFHQILISISNSWYIRPNYVPFGLTVGLHSTPGVL